MKFCLWKNIALIYTASDSKSNSIKAYTSELPFGIFEPENPQFSNKLSVDLPQNKSPQKAQMQSSPSNQPTINKQINIRFNSLINICTRMYQHSLTSHLLFSRSLDKSFTVEYYTRTAYIHSSE